MSNNDSPDRKRQLLKLSPFVGYNFKNEAIGNASNGMGIITAHYDDPFENIALSKMRQNLYCLSNPSNFEEVKNGRLAFQSNHTVVLKDPKAKSLQKRSVGFRLEDLPQDARQALLDGQSPIKRHPVRVVPINEERTKTCNAFEEEKVHIREDYRPIVTEPTPKMQHSKSQSFNLNSAAQMKNMFTVKSNRALGRYSHRNQSNPEIALDTMICESNPIFKRQAPNIVKRLNQPPVVSNTFTRWDERVKSFYDPAIKDKNYQRWNVDKNNL